MSKIYNNRIETLAGFKLNSATPIDDRFAVDNKSDLDTLVSNNVVYDGLMVYVKNEKSIYLYNESQNIWIKFIADGSQEKGSYLTLDKIKDFTYKTEYGVIDYEYAYKYYETEDSDYLTGLCSSIRNGNFYGRNFDWGYSNEATFIVHTPRIADRYESIGVSSGITKLTGQFVDSKKYDEIYKLIPFKLLDGINEFGLFMNNNVVPIDKGVNIAQPLQESKITISALMIIRYVLDHFKTADEAISFIKNHVTMYFPKHLHEMGYELHFMIGDQNKTYLLEVINNRFISTEMTPNSNTHLSGKEYMTNYYLSDIQFNEDGTVTTIEQGNPKSDNLVTDNACGLERYNILVNNYSNANTKTGMRALLKEIKYTNAYITSEEAASPIWYSEYVGHGLTVESNLSDFEEIIELSGQAYLNRSRTDEIPVWHTMHSAIYDIKNRGLYIITQEDDNELYFCIEKNSSLPDVTEDDNGKILQVVNGIWSANTLPVYDGSVE